MGIFGAMTTAVSGLSAQAYALENISGNIANSQTTAFKRIETSFVDLIPDSGPKRELSGSVTGYSRATNTIQGQISATAITKPPPPVRSVRSSKPFATPAATKLMTTAST